MNRSLPTWVGCIGLVCFSAAEAKAQDNRQIPGFQNDAESRSDNRDQDAWSVVIGVGQGYGPLSEGSDDDDFITFPVFNVTFRDLIYVDIQDGVGLNVISEEMTLVSIDANFGTFRSENDEQDSIFADADFERFAGLGELDGGIAIEFYASQIVFDAVELSVSATREFGDIDGWEITAGAATGREVAEDLFLGAQISATWVDERFSQALYGVTDTQAQARAAIAANNPAVSPYDVFDADSGFTDLTIGLGLTQTFGKHDQFFVSLDSGYSIRLGPLRNSPITERTSSFGAALSVGWEL